ncbi:MAG: hypothetical protein ABR529_01580 [Actinomycetota bacterium]
MRLPSGQKNLLAFALIAALGFVVTLYVVPAGTTGPAVSSDAISANEYATEADVSTTDTVPNAPSPFPSEGMDEPPGLTTGGTGPYRGYALSLAELRGLSSDVAPGTRLQLWVSWESPITRHPRVQRLRGVVVVDKIVEPLTPEGPTSVELLIPTKELPDFLFAHRYGALSAVVLP